jgi:hypothetical protein
VAVYRCNSCGFTAPADQIGVLLMEQHLLDEHAVIIDLPDPEGEVEDQPVWPPAMETK